jgi:signal transduction histidine kinase
MRSLVETLRPMQVGRDGLSAALRSKVELAQRMHDATIRLQITGEEQLSEPVQRELLYVAGEALANALQHADAEHVDISVGYGDPVRIVVADDGRGFDLPRTRSTSRRLGLTSLQDRVGALDGTLHIDTAPGRGTTVTVEVPDGC